MGTRRKRRRQHGLWISAADLPMTAAHPFYRRLNALLDEQKFDEFVEGACRSFYAETMGRPSLTPGMYFRLLLVGYFEGIDAERGIAWRAADSLAIRQFLHLALDEAAPDHSTISRTRRLIDLETHRAVFTWIQQRLTEAGLLKGQTVAIDATTLEANAAMRSIVRRDTGEAYQEFLTRLAKESGIETPTREDLARLDRTRKKKTSNKEWTNPHDPDAKVTKMKDGRTHLAHKAEHAVDVETGAIIAVTLQGADQGDTTTIVETAIAAAEQVEDAQADVEEPQTLEEVVADKGYHSNQTMVDLDAVEIRSYIAEPVRGDNEICRTCCSTRECYGLPYSIGWPCRHRFSAPRVPTPGADTGSREHRWSVPYSLRAGWARRGPREGAQRPNVAWRPVRPKTTAQAASGRRSSCRRPVVPWICDADEPSAGCRATRRDSHSRATASPYHGHGRPRVPQTSADGRRAFAIP